MPRNLRVEFPGAIYHLAGLNPALPPEAITAAVDELTRDRPRPRLLPGQVPLASAA
jgi:hypothetical protein